MFKWFLPNLPYLWAIMISVSIGVLLHTAQPSAARPLVTEVSGTIEEDTTWTQANSPYLMTGNILVTKGIHLTIESGINIRGNSGTVFPLIRR